MTTEAQAEALRDLLERVPIDCRAAQLVAAYAERV